MPRKQGAVLGLTRPDLAVFVAYVALLCVAIPHYVPWEDEGRAWVDARFGLWKLVFHILRYEGHPAIWYLILWPFVHLHVSFLAINWISAVLASAGIYVLLRASPFPLYLRALLPFGFALAYEYAVVARNYCLFPLFGFLIAHEYRQSRRRPIRMAVFLALLANLSLHGAIVAVVFGCSYAWDLYRERRVSGPTSWSLAQARMGAAIFAGSIMLVAIILWPPRDLTLGKNPRVIQLMQKFTPAAYHPHSRPARLRLTSSEQGLQDPPDPALSQNLGIGSLGAGARIRMIFVYPIATFAPLALLFQLLVYVLVWRRGKPILLAAPLLLALFLVDVYLKIWHVSLMWMLLIMMLWAVWDEDERFRRVSLQSVTAVLFALICLLQLPWTVAALRFDRTHATYPARATAAYLGSLPRTAKIDGFDHADTLLPYFQNYPFHLQADVLNVGAVLADAPDAIVFRTTTVRDEQLAQLAQAGYQQTHRFCGTPFFPNQPLTPLCLVVLEDR